MLSLFRVDIRNDYVVPGQDTSVSQHHFAKLLETCFPISKEHRRAATVAVSGHAGFDKLSDIEL